MFLIAALAAWLTIPPDRIAHVETPSQVVVVVAPKSCETREVRAIIAIRRGEEFDRIALTRLVEQCKPVVFRFPNSGVLVAVKGWER